MLSAFSTLTPILHDTSALVDGTLMIGIMGLMLFIGKLMQCSIKLLDTTRDLVSRIKRIRIFGMSFDFFKKSSQDEQPPDISGRDMECLALARAVKFHLERRIFLNGNRTVVLR